MDEAGSVIRTTAGEAIKTLRPGITSVSSPRTLSYGAKLKQHTCVFTVTATDTAGNAAVVNGSNKLLVKHASCAHD